MARLFGYRFRRGRERFVGYLFCRGRSRRGLVRGDCVESFGFRRFVRVSRDYMEDAVASEFLWELFFGVRYFVRRGYL